jgi:mono/diheme cytochrome c family protein
MLPSRAMRPVIVVLTALLLAGCGGSGSGGSGSGGSGGSSSAGGGTDGKALFAGTCGGCHTLADAGTTGTFGPNLDELKPDDARVKKAIAQGPGAMPDGLLEGAQADAVARYVASSAGK